MDSSNKAVFLSYASQDADAAKRICDALRAAGVEVWFDRSELVGGDAWDQKIRKQIKECALLIPVISVATQARTEGYFRLEWRLADQRTHLMAKGRAFLLPVVIDDTRDFDAHVPDSFMEVQWTRLPGGETPAAFAERVKKLLEGGVGPVSDRPFGSSAPSEAGQRPAPPRKSPRWLAPVIAGGAIALLAVVIARPWEKVSPPPVAPPPTGTASPASSLSEAQKLVAQARQIYENGDELNRENIFLADDLVKRALVLDPAEPAAAELAAWLSYTMSWQGFDNSDARREMLMRQAARALALAPSSVSAQLVMINARTDLNFAGAGLGPSQVATESERELLALAAREPGDWQVQRALGQTYRFLNRPDESIAALRRAVELSQGKASAVVDLANVLVRLKRYAEAEVLVTPTLARQPTGRVRAIDLLIKCRWQGDLAGAQAALQTWPGWLLQEDRGAFWAWEAWMYSRQPDKALAAALRLQRDYLRDANFTGPRAALTARAHELAGHAEAARAEWRTVIQLADRELAGNPDDPAALYWKTWALMRLGDTAAAQLNGTLLRQRTQSNQMSFFKGTNIAALWVTLGQAELAFQAMHQQLREFNDSYGVTRAMLELDPAYDPLRDDSRFKEVVALAPAPAPKPQTQKPGPSDQPAVDQKSVAVLAFANLSDDKANEYFSDGISEELLNVLAKVPGLKVSARTSAFYFKGKEVTIPEIARQLGVAYVVEGSVRKQGSQVRIRAQLVKAADGFPVWSDTFTRDLKDIFAVQDEIAGLIAKNLSLKLGTSSAAATVAVNPQAFELYVQARRAWNLRNAAGFAQAEELLTRALTLEPKFARAHAALADVWTLRAIANGVIDTFGQRTAPVFTQIVSEIQKALALDPDSSEARASWGLIVRLQQWNLPAAERELRRAIELNPNYATAHHWLGTCLFESGRIEEALVELQRAVELDPFSLRILEGYAEGLVHAGRHEEALAVLARAEAVQAKAPLTLFTKAEALLQLGRRPEALARARELDETDRAELLARAGEKSEAEAALGEAEGWYRYKLLTALGRTAEALAALQAEDVSVTEVGNWLMDPALDPFRKDPHFVKLLETLGLTEAHGRMQAWRAAHPQARPEPTK